MHIHIYIYICCFISYFIISVAGKGSRKSTPHTLEGKGDLRHTHEKKHAACSSTQHEAERSSTQHAAACSSKKYVKMCKHPHINQWHIIFLTNMMLCYNMIIL